MNVYLYKLKPLLKMFAIFSLLIGSLIFTTQAKAASTELNPSVNGAHVQLAYYHYGHSNFHHRNVHRNYGHHNYHRNYHHNYRRY